MLFLASEFVSLRPQWAEVRKLNLTLEQFAVRETQKNIQYKYLDGLDLKRMFFVGVVEEMEKSVSVLGDLFDVKLNPPAKK